MSEEKNLKKPLKAAVIDIGSNSLRMQIAQIENDNIKILENLKYPISLGKDTFAAGSISIEKLDKTCEIIKKFIDVSLEYGVSDIKAIATTAVREAQNKSYILDQILRRTGLFVDVLDDLAEKTLIFKEIVRRLEIVKNYKSASLIAYIGVGNLGISIYNNGIIPFSQNIDIGSLRLSEMLTNMQEYEEQYNIVIEDYLRSFTEVFNNTLPEGDIKHFIASGSEISTIANVCGYKNDDNFIFIDKEKFIKTYESLKNKTTDQIMDEFDLNEDSADILRPAMSIYYMLLNITSAEKIIAPIVYINDAIIFELLKPKPAKEFDANFEKSTITSAKLIASRYDYDEDHTKYVEKYSLKFFDKLKKHHGYGKRERLYLQVAAILHDVGKYINIRSHYNHSYEIIKSSDIVGLNIKEIEIVANIAKYHSTIVPSDNDYNYKNLNNEEKMLVSKLSAMLRLAEALDKGHIKKFDDIDIKIKDNILFIGIRTLMNTQIEEWSFVRKKEFFEHVFLMKAVIKKKKVV